MSDTPSAHDEAPVAFDGNRRRHRTAERLWPPAWLGAEQDQKNDVTADRRHWQGRIGA
jgi:hypothetical protein